jgi:uncharacterized protein (DUF849 family)
MALPALALNVVKEMNSVGRTRYFEEYARYTDSPTRPYAIRIGNKTLHSADTMDLRRQFDRFLQRGHKVASRRVAIKRAVTKLCRFCGQPMKPKGVKKEPDMYDHAQGCPYLRSAK